jgi:hypothetical protein
MVPEEDDPFPPLSGEVGELRRSPNIKIPEDGGMVVKADSTNRDGVGTSLEIEVELEGLQASARFQTLSGLAMKQCPRIFTLGLLWQTRYLSLQPDGTLYYYSSRREKDKGGASLGVIVLSDVRKDRKSGKKYKIVRTNKELVIGVHAKNRRNYRFKFENDIEASRWETAIRSHL